VPRRSRTLPYGAPHGEPRYIVTRPDQVLKAAPKRPQPLLKRLFTSFGPWAFSSSDPSPKPKHPPLRRRREDSK
jgi:hypothetical protein